MNAFLISVFLVVAMTSAAMAGTINRFIPSSDLNVTSSSCGGNCYGGCDSCPCGSSKSQQSVSSWCGKYSGWNQKNCECIMNAESGGNANAVNENTDGSYDVGLWQINDFNWNACSGGKAPCSPSDNLACAKDVYAWGGNTWKLWSTCSKCGCCSSS